MKKFLFVVAILGAIQWFFLRDGCGTKGSVACPAKELEEGVGVTLSSRDVCPSAGYLCYQRASVHVMRWSLEKGRLRIRVPLPDFLDAEKGERIRQAAITGLQEWDGHPFPIVIDTGKFSFRSPDITVVWSQTMNPHAGSAGTATQQGREDGKRLIYSVDTVTVVVPQQFAALPGVDAAALEPLKGQLGLNEMGPGLLEWVRAIASHELGHALGLAHSDSTNDVMYFQLRQGDNQASASARDFQTVEALYALPNGAMVQ
jgi:predicted Zn-dependent protease